MRDDQATPESPVSVYGRTLRRRAWWVIGTTVIVVGAALGYSLYQTKLYSASATLQVQGSSPSGKTSGIVTPAAVQTDVEIMTSIGVRDLVKAKLHLTVSPPVAAQSSGTNDLFTVSATAHSPALAATYANAYAAAFIAFEKNLDSIQFKQLTVSTQAEARTTLGQIQALDKTLAGQGVGTNTKTGKTTPLTPGESEEEQQLQNLQTTYNSYQAELVQVGIDSHEATGGAVVLGPATTPKAPSSPKTDRNVTLGFMVGLILGLILAFGIDALDDTIKSKEDIERAYPRLPNLGVIPVVDTWKVATTPYLVALKAPLSQPTEAYRSLRTAVEFSRMHRSVRSILITSSMDFEGKTSTAANLAVTFAKAGQRTLLVSGDLRRPRMATFFGASDEVGLASLALGIATFDEAVSPVADVPGLYYLGTGPLPAEAAEFLSSRKVEEIFRGLRERFDVVIVDSPPSVLVTDSMIMSRYVDAVVLVVAQGRTRRRSLMRVRELAEQVDAPVIGTILNGAATKGADAYGYGYGYRYGYRYGYGYGQTSAYAAEPKRGGRRSKQGMKPGSTQPAPALQSGLDAESEQTGS